MKKIKLLLVSLVFLLMAAPLLKAQTRSNESETLQVGAAKNKITAPVGSIMGNSYGMTIAKGVHDDLYARTLVFNQKGVKAAFIAVDLISIPHEIIMKTRELIAQTTGIPANNIIMAAIHAHAGPQLNPLFWEAIGGLPKKKSQAYHKSLPGMIAKSVQVAESKLQPARLSVGTVQEKTVNFNRRFFMDDGTFRTNPGRMNPKIVRPSGTVDPDISMVYVESLDAKPLALLVNFALHPAIVGGDHFSADFPGVVCEQLAKVKGEEMVTVYTNGTSGNVNHIDVAQQDQLEGFEESRRVGTILAGKVLGALPSLRPIAVDQLQVRGETVEIPVPVVKDEEVKWAQEVFAQLGKQASPPFSDIVKAWRLLDIFEPKWDLQARHASTTTIPMVKNRRALESEVQAIALGNELALVGFPGDSFVELGLTIKQNSPFPFTVVSEQSGNGTISYMPNRKAFPEGGYEVESARFSPGGAEKLVDATVQALIKLFPYK